MDMVTRSTISDDAIEKIAEEQISRTYRYDGEDIPDRGYGDKLDGFKLGYRAAIGNQQNETDYEVLRQRRRQELANAQREDNERNFTAELTEALTALLGEPSKEQVELAAREYHERGNGEGSFDRMADHVRSSLIFRMRCALRAAGVAAPVTDQQVANAVLAIKRRLEWASLHWGADNLHPDALPHIARAALEGTAHWNDTERTQSEGDENA